MYCCRDIGLGSRRGVTLFPVAVQPPSTQGFAHTHRVTANSLVLWEPLLLDIFPASSRTECWHLLLQEAFRGTLPTDAGGRDPCPLMWLSGCIRQSTLGGGPGWQASDENVFKNLTRKSVTSESLSSTALSEPSKATSQVQIFQFILCGHILSTSGVNMQFDNLWTMGF